MAARIELSDENRMRLEKWTRARSVSVRLRERAQIILPAASSMMNKAAAAELGIEENEVGRRRVRVAAEGVSMIERKQPWGEPRREGQPCAGAIHTRQAACPF